MVLMTYLSFVRHINTRWKNLVRACLKMCELKVAYSLFPHIRGISPLIYLMSIFVSKNKIIKPKKLFFKRYIYKCRIENYLLKRYIVFTLNKLRRVNHDDYS